MTQNRQIYHQGHFDGACFLYSVTNTYKALTGKVVTGKDWDRLLTQVPGALNFFQYSIGATQYTLDQVLDVTNRTLAALDEEQQGFDIHQIERSAGLSEICDHISADSVVHFAFRGNTEFQQQIRHVVCGVAFSTDPLRLYTACSSVLSRRIYQLGDYYERHHPEFGRYSNDSITKDCDITIAPNWRLKITLRENRG